MEHNYIDKSLCEQIHKGIDMLCAEKHRVIEQKLNTIIGTMITLALLIVGEIVVMLIHKGTP